MGLQAGPRRRDLKAYLVAAVLAASLPLHASQTFDQLRNFASSEIPSDYTPNEKDAFGKALEAAGKQTGVTDKLEQYERQIGDQAVRKAEAMGITWMAAVIYAGTVVKNQQLQASFDAPIVGHTKLGVTANSLQVSEIRSPIFFGVQHYFSYRVDSQNGPTFGTGLSYHW
jgi:hypothetical protein